MSYTTIFYDGHEKTAAAWGVALGSLQAQFTNLRADTLRLSIPSANITDDPVFAFEGKIILRLNRTSATGAMDSFSGGTVEFIGYRLNNLADGRPEYCGVHYTFANAWYFLENSLFQQKRATIPTTYPALNYKYTTDVSLFMKLGAANEFVKLTTGQQISAVLQFLLDNPPSADAAPYIIGTIDPALNPPTFQTQEVSCAQTIQKCLEPSPDCTIYWDYTTTSGGSPRPTIHVRKRANLTPVTLAFANGTDHKSLSIRPCYELIPRSVLIYYRINSSISGVEFVSITLDKYGPSGAGVSGSGDPDAGHRVVIQTFDLQGPTSSTISAILNVEACNANHGTPSTQLDWWKQFVPKLRNTDLVEVVTCTIDNVDVFASYNQSGFTKGDTVSLATYPNTVAQSAILDWMRVGGDPVIGVGATITAIATVKFRKRASTDHGWTTEADQKLSIQAQVLLTNGTSGTYTSSGGTLGEDVPTGVAQEIYNSLATLQFEGQHLLVEAAITGQIGMGNVLNLSGGRTAWATMNAQVQQIGKDYGAGTTAVSIGPARHISGADIVALCLFNRTRRLKESNTVRVTGTP